VTSEEISAIMQMRCREKKKIGGVTEKKTNEIKEEENKLNGTIDENSNASIVAADDNDNSDLVKEETSPKRNAQRTAKEKVTKYAGDNDDEEDDSVIHGMEIDDGDQESDYMGSDSDTEKKIKKKQIQNQENLNQVMLIRQHLQLKRNHLSRKMDWMTLRKMEKITMKHHQKLKQKNRKNLALKKNLVQHQRRNLLKKSQRKKPLKKNQKKPLNDLNQMIVTMMIFRSYRIHQLLQKNLVHNVVQLQKRIIIFPMMMMMMKMFKISSYIFCFI